MHIYMMQTEKTGNPVHDKFQPYMYNESPTQLLGHCSCIKFTDSHRKIIEK